MGRFKEEVADIIGCALIIIGGIVGVIVMAILAICIKAAPYILILLAFFLGIKYLFM